MIMKFLKVPKKQGEKIRQQLAEAGIIDNSYPIIRQDGFLLIPVKEGWGDLEIVEMEAEKRPEQYKKLKDALKGALTDEELDALTTSFDLIGDIAIVEVPAELGPKEKDIGDALLKVHRNLRSVFKKLGPMEGEYRVRRLGLIAGEDKTETTYTEHGCTMRLDVSKVYFSVRLATERKRIAGLVKPGEKVLVLFAGVGPFALVIAKDHPDADITAVELNPDAVRYMEENIRLNRLTNIKVLEGDVRDFGYRDFDRVVMPLPHSAEKFLDLASSAARPGATIHLYTIVRSDKPFENARQKAKGFEVLSERIVRPYSATMVQVVLDLINAEQESD